MFEEKQFICSLIEIYGKLLTNRQLEILKDYYFYDFSFAEIGERLSISKQAVKDSLDNSKLILAKYENILQIAHKKDEFLDLHRNKSKIEVNEYLQKLEKIFRE